MGSRKYLSPCPDHKITDTNRKLQGKVDWLVGKITQPIVQFIIHRTPLKSLIQEISKKIEEALGVSVLKDKVSKALGSALENLGGVVTTLQTQADLAVPLFDTVSCPIRLESLVCNTKLWPLQQFTKDLDGLRKVPTTKLFEIVSKGIVILS